MSDRIKMLALEKRGSTAVILIDMQEDFVCGLTEHARDKIITGQRRIIQLCVDHDIPFFTVEYQGHGETIPELSEEIEQVKRRWTVLKLSKSAFSQPVLRQILTDLHISQLVLMGVNASLCVFFTARDARDHGYQLITGNELIANCRYHVNLEDSPHVLDWYRRFTTFEE